MAKMKVTQEVKDNSAGGDFKAFEPGERDFEIREVKPERESQAGNPCCSIGFVVASGDNVGRFVWETYQTSVEKAGRLRNLYQAVFDVDPMDEVKVGETVDPYEWAQELEGHYVRSEAVIVKDMNGKDVNVLGGPSKKEGFGGFVFEKSPLDGKKGATPGAKPAVKKPLPSAKPSPKPSPKKK